MAFSTQTNFSNYQADETGDVIMVPIASTVEQLAGSLRQLREEVKDEIEEVDMEDVFEQEFSDWNKVEPSGIVAIIDTNILIGHLSLLEWVGDLMVAARQSRIGNGARCGLLIPKMVRTEVDKHKRPQNKNRMVTAMIEPCPSGPTSQNLSIHSPDVRKARYCDPLNEVEAVRISLAQAADHAVNWMTRMYQDTPFEHRVLRFQTKDEVSDITLAQAFGKTNEMVSPDAYILDCAIYFKRQLTPSGGDVLLLTNDKALSLEAGLEGIQTLRVQPGLTCQSLLRILDPFIAEHIDQLITSISLTRMTMFNIYMRPVPTKQRESHVLTDPKVLKCESDVVMCPSSQLAVQNGGYDDFEADVMMVDEPPPPMFPVVHWDTLMLSSALTFPDLLEFHQYLLQAVASLLRRPLFEHISAFETLGSLSDVYQMCTSALNRRQLYTIDRNPHNAAEWTASDCLVIIDECWNDGCCNLFRRHFVLEEDSRSTTSLECRPAPKMVSSSQWAPVSTHPRSTAPSVQPPEPHSSQFSVPIRKVIQVLRSQLLPFRRDQLPRDNPLSWSQLLWEGLIEDIYRVLIAGKFLDSLLSDTIGSSPHNYLRSVIQSWILEARRLCNLRSNSRIC